LVLLLLLTPPLTAPLGAEPSFACRTAKTARELAVCADARLAAGDRELAAAWQAALARLDAETAKVLRDDQKKFLVGLDEGFDSDIWGKAGAPEGAALRAAVAQLRWGADADPFAALQAQMRERIAFLRALAPAAAVTGLWKNRDAELLIAAAPLAAPTATTFEGTDEGRYGVRFGLTSYGFDKYHCHFTAKFQAAATGLLAPGARNTDPEVAADIAGTLRIGRGAGATLTLTDTPPAKTAGADPAYVCPRAPALTGPLFHTGLTADQAFRLKPDTD
jgi:hypothetical protein